MIDPIDTLIISFVSERDDILVLRTRISYVRHNRGLYTLRSHSIKHSMRLAKLPSFLIHIHKKIEMIHVSLGYLLKRLFHLPKRSLSRVFSQNIHPSFPFVLVISRTPFGKSIISTRHSLRCGTSSWRMSVC